MPALLARLAAVCSDHLLREKILVVPSLAIGHQITDAVAHGGTPWVNLRVETVRTLADAVAGFALAKEGVTVLSRAQALAMIERACDRVLDSTSYFAALADRPGLHRAIQKSIDDLRHAAIDPSKIKTPAFEDRRKAEDLVRILAAYDEELQRGRYVDRFGVLARAISMLGAGAARPWAKDAIWIAVEDVELTTAEERLLTLAAGNYEKLNSGGQDSPPVKTMDFRRAVGEENELRGAFRAILDAKTPFDDAEIVYTTRDPYLPLAYELSAEYEIPCTFAEGIAGHYTRPGQACLAFLRWIGDGWHAVDLQRAARAGAFATPGFARILRRSRIGWGRDRYLRRIDLLLADDKISERTREAAEAAREIVLELLTMTEAIAEGDTMDVPAAARAASAFVAKFAHIRNDIDGMAREGLRRMLDELSVLGAQAPQRSEVASRLSEAVRNLHVAASNPRPGFLHVAPVRAGGWSARSRMFVVGLDESKHPGSGLQDPIILDIERQAIRIPIVGDRPQRSTEQFRRLLGRASNRQITLSYASLALQDRRDRFPSSSLLEMYRASTNNPNATYEEVGSNITREGFVDPLTLSGSEWWLLRRFADGDSSIGAAVLDAYAGLAAGAQAVAARESDEITKWDGLIAAPPEELDPRRNGRVYSASQIENMAGCPYRHFLQRILRVYPLDEIAYEQDTWLEASEFGSLMHEVLQSTMDELCANGRKPSMDFLPGMRSIADEALKRYRDEIPPPSEAAFEKRRKDLFDSCEIFLRMEEEACRTVSPKYFEVSFGADEDQGLAMPEPFTLPLGRGASVKLRGRIDRVDHDETADEWHVWDYKSGSTYTFDRGGVLACGTKIQHAIYARAVEAMLQAKGMTPRVTRSGYLFPTAKGGGARLLRECSDQELKQALNSLFDVVASGFFPHGNADACKFCDFKSVCGGEEVAAGRMEKKFAKNASHPAVKAWLNLQDVK
jgi:ATP-dependent helicase/nuclease subunit B